MIRLSIPTPCHQKWSGLTTVPGGGFCTSCQKQVIDFTNLSEQEIVTHVSGIGGKVCGRFRKEQLSTDYTVKESPRIKPGISLIKAGVVGLFLLMMSKPALAQEQTKKQSTEVVREKQESGKSLSVEDEEYWIEGFIHDKSLDYAGCQYNIERYNAWNNL